MEPKHKEYILNNIDRLSVKRISQDLNIKEKKIWEFLQYRKTKEKQLDFPSQNTEILAKKKPAVLSIALIIILGFIVYGNSFNGQFIWDDEHLIRDNIYTELVSYAASFYRRHRGGK